MKSRAVTVIVKETDDERSVASDFKSLRKAARATNVSEDIIRDCCNGKREHDIFKFKWI